ncbi:alkaline phosphatase family protein [Tunturiibacter psychrotolerans]
MNFIQQSKFWDSTAIIVTYDDSDGWYDHQFRPHRKLLQRDRRLPQRQGSLRRSKGDSAGHRSD